MVTSLHSPTLNKENAMPFIDSYLQNSPLKNSIDLKIEPQPPICITKKEEYFL